MPDTPVPAAPLPDAAVIARRLARIGGHYGMTSTESRALVLLGIGALADTLAGWAEVHGLTITDLAGWLDQVAQSAVSLDQPQRHT